LLVPSKRRFRAALTSRLVDGAVLIAGAAGTLLELQQVGFHYANKIALCHRIGG
jgi:hypothetical protein